MSNPLRLLAIAAVILFGTGSFAGAQTVMVRGAVPGETIEVVLNGAPAGTGTIDGTGVGTATFAVPTGDTARARNECAALPRHLRQGSPSPRRRAEPAAARRAGRLHPQRHRRDLLGAPEVDDRDQRGECHPDRVVAAGQLQPEHLGSAPSGAHRGDHFRRRRAGAVSRCVRPAMRNRGGLFRR